MTPLSCGLDFGTSNSTLGLVREGDPVLVPLEDGKVTMPTALFLAFSGGAPSYGRQAVQDYIDGAEGRLLRALKSILGTSLMAETTRIGYRQLAFTDILGLFIQQMKRSAEAFAGEEIFHVVMGRPVHFVDHDAAADARAQGQLEAAARAQGFKHIEFQFEPLAAALAYEHQVTKEELALIVDIGGGTSDFSVVRVSPERAKAADRKEDILANAGVHLGGTDFDRLLSLARVMPELGYKSQKANGNGDVPSAAYFDLATWQRIPNLYAKGVLYELGQIQRDAAQPELLGRLIEVVRHKLGHALAGQVEAAKIALTTEAQTLLELMIGGDALRLPLTRRDVDEALTEAGGRIVAKALDTLALAGVGPEDIQTVFLTGGSTQVPVVKGPILGLFPHAKIVEGDMFGSVGLGLALEARRVFG